MTHVLETISVWAIPVLTAFVCIYAVAKKVPAYTVFTEGAKEGFSVAVMIIPYLVAMLCAIGMLRASGALEWICDLLAPITNLIGMPSEILPMGIMRSFSGGAAEGLLVDLLENYGTQSQIGRIASVALGSTETTFYVIAVYFGCIGIKDARQAVPAGLLGDLASLIAATVIVNIMWF